jgi:hypothetical protein
LNYVVVEARESFKRYSLMETLRMVHHLEQHKKTGKAGLPNFRGGKDISERGCGGTLREKTPRVSVKRGLSIFLLPSLTTSSNKIKGNVVDASI